MSDSFPVVVLVRPAIAANIGAVARVMRNFGVADLRLVAPHADPRAEDARRLSTHGEAILDHCRSFARLEDALADCSLALGTSARTGGPVRRQSVVPLPEIMERAPIVGMVGPVAWVFGPEQSGLTDGEVTRCHYLVTIPTDESYPALNLAQAVGICLYEWSRGARPRAEGVQAAPFALQDRMFAQLEEALRAIHFLWGDNAEPLMHALRHLIGRARPSSQEVELLLGLARQIQWSRRDLPGRG